jgi:hypothetical protein
MYDQELVREILLQVLEATRRIPGALIRSRPLQIL